MREIIFRLFISTIFILPYGKRAGADEIALLKRLVEIPSGTGNIAGVYEVEKIVKSELESMGFSVELTPENPSHQKLLIATLAGENPAFITFVAHADTVFEESSGFTGFKIEDLGVEKIARGPGVIDDKGGLVVAIEGLRKYLAGHRKPKFSLRFVVSPSEETGSAGFLEDFKKFAPDSKLVLGFEPSLDDGSIINARRGNRWYLIKVTGREAHAGRDHKKGVNACLELATKLEKMSALTDYAKNVTVSVGHIEGGQDKFNIVCGFAQAKVDTRFGDLKNRDALARKIEKILETPKVSSAEDHVPAKTEFNIADDCPPFSATPASAAVVKKYLAGLEGRATASAKASGGSADSNYFSRPGVIVIDGLGATGGGMHTKDEHVVLSSLDTKAQALSHFLENF